MNTKIFETKNGGTINMDPSPELSTQIYGFKENSESEQMFIQDIETGLNLEDGKYFGEFERIYSNIKGDTSNFTANNLNIIGAVVTGKASDLSALNDMDMIRASALGVTANPNQ